MEELKYSWGKVNKHRNNTEKLSKHFFRALAISNLRDGKASFENDASIGITEKQFHEKFGSEGIEIITDLMTCQALNGGKAHKDEDGYFSGLEYSIAVGFYAMDRALSNHNTAAYRKRVYDQFIDDVSHMWFQTNRKIKGVFVPMPTQKRLQDICRPKLKKLRDLGEERRAEHSNKDALVTPEIPDYVAL